MLDLVRTILRSSDENPEEQKANPSAVWLIEQESRLAASQNSAFSLSCASSTELSQQADFNAAVYLYNRLEVYEARSKLGTIDSLVSNPLIPREQGNPMRIVAFLNDIGKETPENMTLYQEPTLITGFGDPCQVLASYVVEPKLSMIVFRFQITNITPNLIENLNIVL